MAGNLQQLNSRRVELTGLELYFFGRGGVGVGGGGGRGGVAGGRFLQRTYNNWYLNPSGLMVQRDADVICMPVVEAGPMSDWR